MRSRTKWLHFAPIPRETEDEAVLYAIHSQHDRRNRRIFEKWLQCYTQEEIAEHEGVHRDTVNEICRKMKDFSESDKVLAGHHEPDFKRPLYNVWKWQEKTEGANSYHLTE